MSLTVCRFPRGRLQLKCIHLLNLKRGNVLYAWDSFFHQTVDTPLHSAAPPPLYVLNQTGHRPLLLGKLTDRTRSKSELVAENALICQQLVILRRQVKRRACTKTVRVFLVFLEKDVRIWKQALFLVSEDDTSLLASSENGCQCYAAVTVQRWK
jgi:hypothetical protein